MGGEVPGVEVVNITAPQLIKQQKKLLSQVKNGKLSSKSREFSEIEKSCMSRVRRNAEGFLETEQWKCRVMQLPRGGCHSSTAMCKVVMMQWWSAQKTPMCLCCFWPFPVPLMPEMKHR